MCTYLDDHCDLIEAFKPLTIPISIPDMTPAQIKMALGNNFWPSRIYTHDEPRHIKYDSPRRRPA